MNRPLKRITVALFLLLGVSACAGMDVAECQSADWRAIGYEDGTKGQSPNQFGTYRKACAEHGVTANLDAYLAGRDEGLIYFCRPQNGYDIGRRGHAYSGVCPPTLEAAFVSAHADGYGLYERQLALKTAKKRLNEARARSEELEYLLAEQIALLIAPALAPSERATLVVELKQLTEEKVELENAMYGLEQDYAEAKRNYDTFRNSIAYRQ